MNIKNIAFSGFAAAILAGVCGAADAATVNLASKSYVDNALAGKASIEDFKNLESTVGQKATQAALKEVADQVVINTNDIAALKAAGYLTDADLIELQQTLQAAIDEKQAKGNYADADELAALKTTVENLQTGNVDKTVIENLQTTVNTISADYAKKSELTATEEKLQAAIDAIKIPELTDYAKTADVESALALKENAANKVASATAEQIDAMSSTEKETKFPSISVAQTIANAAVTKVNEVAGDLSSLQTQVNTNAADITEIKGAGYQTADDVQGAITTAVADLATKSEVGAKQDKLTAGTNIEISENNTISANVDLTGLATSEQLTTLQNTLQAAINEKQDAGEYLVAADLTTLNEAITALQSGKADASTVTTIQETISKLGDTYASKADMTAADAALQAAIDNMDLSAYAKVADVYSKTEADAKFLIMRDANALGANLQWDEDGKLNTKGIATADGLKELEDKVADAVTQTELDAKGYLTAEAVTSGTENGTIAVNGSDVAVKGLGSAAYTTAENYIIKPTEQPNTFGEYVLILNINEAGESEGYSWLDTQDFIGGVDEW